MMSQREAWDWLARHLAAQNGRWRNVEQFRVISLCFALTAMLDLGMISQRTKDKMSKAIEQHRPNGVTGMHWPAGDWQSRIAFCQRMADKPKQ